MLIFIFELSNFPFSGGFFYLDNDLLVSIVKTRQIVQRGSFSQTELQHLIDLVSNQSLAEFSPYFNDADLQF